MAQEPAPPSNESSAMLSSAGTSGNWARVGSGSQLQALCDRATRGASEDIQRLGKWAALVEQEAQFLRRRLRKQQHDFATLFEIVGQTSARSMDLLAMQTYLLRTVSGHFATTRLLILRRMRSEDSELTCTAAQGVRDQTRSVPLSSVLCQQAMDKRFCFSLSDLPPGGDAHVAEFSKLGLSMIVPLVQEVERPDAVLEGLLVLGPRMGGQTYSNEDFEFLHVLGKMLAICLRNEALYRRSIIDDLTGVASRGHFDAELSQELNRIMTYGHRSMGLVMLDVDHFKDFNDSYGHQTGDRVLQELARVLVNTVRNVDLVARYGGEEFAIILLEIDRAKVLEVAGRLRKSVEELEVNSVQGQKLRITASFGLACFPDDAQDKSTLIQLADEALYRAKESGRNRIVMSESGSGLSRAIAPARPASVPLQGARAKPDPALPGRGGSRRSSFPTLRSHGDTLELEQIHRLQNEVAQLPPDPTKEKKPE